MVRNLPALYQPSEPNTSIFSVGLVHLPEEATDFRRPSKKSRQRAEWSCSISDHPPLLLLQRFTLGLEVGGGGIARAAT
jgi:hypothetical protein